MKNVFNYLNSLVEENLSSVERAVIYEMILFFLQLVAIMLFILAVLLGSVYHFKY
ncbi:hypothetical protein [Sphingobacterium paludis]|uniref:Uncharacterized protein n=1 Tax=Sphingobacterium paludis TaxID=1476465 RepID=A0A4V3E1W0_9SPHI|nr:hypothetical protein [Sphingobacterium paludis]TDS14778.1 hypothetical protein B0I21_103277 [Sphingobacterium paludis]